MDTLKRSLSALLVLVMVLGMLPMSALAAEGVPEEIYRIEYDGHEYALMTGCGSWNAAKTYCQDVGGYLATITSEEENLVLHEFILTMGVENAYFGLSYAQESDSWTWVTGEAVSYENWGAGEPGSVNAGENYGLFYYDFPDGGWSHGSYGEETVGKGYPLFFLCEWGDYAADAEPEETKNEQYIQTLIDNSNGGRIVIEEDIVIENDFKIEGGSFLQIKGSITVLEGVTLTLGCDTFVYGNILVENGGVLCIDWSTTVESGGLIRIDDGAKLVLNKGMSVSGTLEVSGEYEYTSYFIVYADYNQNTRGNVTGIPKEKLGIHYFVWNDQDLQDAVKTGEAGYLAVNIIFTEAYDCILTEDTIIPNKVCWSVHNNITISEGVTLTVIGEIDFGTGVIYNNGNIINDGAIFINSGRLVNQGTMRNNCYVYLGAWYPSEGVGTLVNNGTFINEGYGEVSIDSGLWEGNAPVSSHNHTYTETVTAPTCTEKGYTTYTCECGDSYTGNEVAALGHAEVTDKAIEATCTEAGKTEGKHCDRCGEIIVAQTEVPAKGHSFGDWYVTKEATTEAEGQERRDCAACDHFETRAIPKVEIPTEGQCGGSLTWSYDKTTGTLTITGSGAMWNFTISLKQKSADPMVPWAAYQSEIKAVVLSEGITSIGNNAFAGCENLTEVTLPKTVTAIGEDAFLDSGLKEITFQGDAPQVSESAFQGVSATITYPQDNETWTDDKKQDFGGDLEWSEPEDDHGYQLGDVNHDTKINAKDATLILQKSVGVLKETTAFCEDCAEVSGDGRLNAKDSTLILQFSVGLRDSFLTGK